MEKEEYQRKIKEMEKQLFQLSTAPSSSSTLQVKQVKNLTLRNETVSSLSLCKDSFCLTRDNNRISHP